MSELSELQQLLNGSLGETETTSVTYTPPSTATTAVAYTDTTPTVAMQRLNTMYAELADSMNWMIKTYGNNSKRIPCKLRAAYNNGVRAYQTIATDIYAQTIRQGFIPVQQIKDASGKITAEYRDGIVRIPGSFAECTGADAGLKGDELGLPPLVWIVGVIVTVIVAGTAAVVGARWLWPNKAAEDYEISRKIMLDTQNCVRQAMLPPLKMNSAAASEYCHVDVPPDLKDGNGLGFWGTIGVVAVVLGVGAGLGYWFWRKTSPAEQEHRRRQFETKEEAARLRAEARRLQMEARKPRIARPQSRYSATGSEYDTDVDTMSTEVMGADFGRSAGHSGMTARFKGCICT